MLVNREDRDELRVLKRYLKSGNNRERWFDLYVEVFYEGKPLTRKGVPVSMLHPIFGDREVPRSYLIGQKEEPKSPESQWKPKTFDGAIAREIDGYVNQA
jgi:hypothetical protein